MTVKDLVELKNIILGNGNNIKAFVNNVQYIPVTGDLLLVTVAGCRFFFHQLTDSCICGNDALNGVRCLRALHLGDLNQLFQFLRPLLQI